MGFIILGRLDIRKRYSCASALVSLSAVQTPSVYKSHILNGPINKQYIVSISDLINYRKGKVPCGVPYNFFCSISSIVFLFSFAFNELDLLCFMVVNI